MRAVRSSTASAAASVSCNPPCSSWYLVTALAIVVLHVLGDAFDAFGVALGQLHVYGRRRCFAVRGVAQGLAGPRDRTVRPAVVPCSRHSSWCPPFCVSRR